MTDINELINRLREAKLFGSTLYAEAADALSRLQAGNAELRQKCDHIMQQHGERLEEVARLREDAERLDSGSILMHERDEFGDEYDVLHCGLDLRKAIDAARQMEAKIPR